MNNGCNCPLPNLEGCFTKGYTVVVAHPYIVAREIDVIAVSREEAIEKAEAKFRWFFEDLKATAKLQTQIIRG